MPLVSEASVYELIYDIHQVTEISEDKPEIKKKDYVIVVTIAPSNISIKNHQAEIIYDLNNLAITTIDHDNKKYTQHSFYPEVIFRGKEMFNRLEMNIMLATFKNQEITRAQNEFAVESLFGVKLRNALEKEIKEETNGNTHNFIFGGKQTVSITFDNTTINDTLKNSFQKFIVYHLHLHPSIRNKILNYNKLFSSLTYTYEDLNKTITTRMLLKSVKERDDNPITVPTAYQKIYGENIKKSSILIKAHSKSGMISEKQYKDEIDILIDQKKYLDAFLAIHEYIFQYESKPIEQFKKVMAASGENSQVYQLAKSLEPHTKEEVEQSIKLISELTKQNLKHHYILKVFLANIYGSQKAYNTAYSYFDQALERNPFMCSVYLDYSQLLLEDYETYLAWQLIEAVRDFMPSYSRLAIFTQMEERMKQLNPEFF
jgi:hypothetical protein